MNMPLTLVLLALTGAVQAEQIDIYTTAGFGCLHQYHDADTSLVPSVTLTLPQVDTGGMSLFFSDAVDPVTNAISEIWAGTYYGSGVPTVLTSNVSGNQMTLTITETSYRKLINQGRGQRWCTKWTLQSGTIIR
jgi:hypothetical protein